MVETLLKLFFPSWKFFADSSSSLELVFALSQQEGEWSDWEALLTSPANPDARLIANSERKWRHLFHSPAENERLFQFSCLERLVQQSQVSSPDKVPHLKIYKIVFEIVHSHINHLSFIRLQKSQKAEDQVISSKARETQFLWKFGVRFAGEMIFVSLPHTNTLDNFYEGSK